PQAADADGAASEESSGPPSEAAVVEDAYQETASEAPPKAATEAEPETVAQEAAEPIDVAALARDLLDQILQGMGVPAAVQGERPGSRPGRPAILRAPHYPQQSGRRPGRLHLQRRRGAGPPRRHLPPRCRTGLTLAVGNYGPQRRRGRRVPAQRVVGAEGSD